MGMRRAIVRRHLHEREAMTRLQTQASFAASGYVTLTRFARLALQSLALGAGALLAVNNQISPGAIFAASFLIARALAPIEQVLGAWKSLVQARSAYKTLTDLFIEEGAEPEHTALPAPTGRIAVENLTVLNARRDGSILGDIRFTVEAGEIVGIIGPSGAGKSTLVRLIAGAAAPDRGTIRFDGADRKDWDPERLGEHIGFMPQEATLFAGSIKANICRFRNYVAEDPSVVDMAVIDAARRAGAHEMILRLPQGYDTELTLGGRGLSAGQAQRIALARALYGSPNLLILDEPNAHLDAEGEALLLETLAAVKARGGTVLIVAHRTGVLAALDKLMVLRDGRVEPLWPARRGLAAHRRPATAAQAGDDPAGSADITGDDAGGSALSRALIASLASAKLPSISHGDVSAESADDPQPELRFGMIVAGVFFVGFLGWAALAPMDQAAYATGKVSVAGHRQTVQHREGGVVSAMFVKEGQQVQKDQVLIQLAGGDIEAQAHSLAATVIGLKAQRARLVAEQLGAPIQWPAEFQALTGSDLEEAQRAMKIQTGQFQARASTHVAQGGVYGQRTAQYSEEIKGYERQVTSTDTEIRLINEEIVGMKTLNERGFAPITQVRALERQMAQLQSQRAALVAQIASSREQIGETRLENVQSTSTNQQDVAKEIRDVDFQLNDASPKLQAAQDELARTQIRSPATGTVVGLTVFTVGGVIAPGQKILDVVPAKAPLVLEAQVSPNDADDLHVGRVPVVRVTGMHERGLPRLTGKLTKHLRRQLQRREVRPGLLHRRGHGAGHRGRGAAQDRGKEFSLKPGMPVQILVPLKKRTALQYLFEPLTEARWKSLPRALNPLRLAAGRGDPLPRWAGEVSCRIQRLDDLAGQVAVGGQAVVALPLADRAARA